MRFGLISVTYAGLLLICPAGSAFAAAQIEVQEFALQEQSRGDSSSEALQRMITLDLQNVLLADALEEIGRKADLPLVYSRALLPSEQRFSIRASRITAGGALTRLLEGTGLELRALTSGQVVIVRARSADLRSSVASKMRLIASTAAPLAVPAPLPPTLAQATVRGRVTDATTAAPIGDVQIVIEGTQHSSLTRPDGAFLLAAVPAGSYTIRAQRIGYAAQSQELTLLSGQTATVNFSLQPAAVALQEVVVVGYGEQRREDMTGSVATVTAERLEQSTATSVEQALQGIVPGLQIRTTQAGAETDFDVQIRGAGSLLASTRPLIVLDGIPYSGPISEINQNDIESISVLKDASAAAIYGSRGANGVIILTTKRGSGRAQINYDGYAGVQQIAHMPRLFSGPEWAEFRCTRRNDGVYGDCDQHLDASERRALELGRSTNWLDLATRTGRQFQHNLSVSGATEGTRYHISASALNTAGVAVNDDFDRYTLRANVEQEVNSWISVGTNTQLGWTDRSGLPVNWSDSGTGAFWQNPLMPAYAEDGSLVIHPWPEDPFFVNPLGALRAVNQDQTRRVFTSNYLELQLPVEGLSYRLNAGADLINQEEGTFWGRDTGQGLGAQGLANTLDRAGRDWTVENLIRYSGAFANHRIDALGLFSAQSSRDQFRALQSRGFPGDELTYWQANVASAVVPTYGFTELGLVSQMGRLNYTYDDRYVLTLTARRDGASVFGEANKYGVFPSVALGWNISNERFWPTAEALSFLKLRGSWGMSGNQAIQPYQTLARMTERSYVRGSETLPGFITASMANQDLKWETTRTLNLGMDFGLFANRLTGVLDIYQANTTDLLLDRLIPSTHGVSRIVSNMGEVQNRGVEFGLSSLNWQRRNFRWTTDLNISANRNRIIDLYGDGNDDLANHWFIGHPINVNFDYEILGVWQVDDDIANSPQPNARPGDLRFRDVTGDGQITADDRVILGSPEPSWTGGLINTLRYGNASLSFFLQTVQGVQQANRMIQADYSWPDVRRNIMVVPFWTPENRNNVFPANRMGTNPFEADFYRDASFVRLKDVNLSLDFPAAWSERIAATRFRVYASGRNLVTWTRWQGSDPEFPGSGDKAPRPDMQRGVPLERVLILGINLGF